MTTSPAGRAGPPGNRSRRSAGPRRVTPKIRPVQILAVAVVLAVFTVGVVIGGVLGAAVVALLSLAAGGLLVAHWSVLDPRIRTFRAVVVLLGFAVALSLYLR